MSTQPRHVRAPGEQLDLELASESRSDDFHGEICGMSGGSPVVAGWLLKSPGKLAIARRIATDTSSAATPLCRLSVVRPNLTSGVRCS